MASDPQPAKTVTIHVRAESGCHVRAEAQRQAHGYWGFRTEQRHPSSLACRCRFTADAAASRRNEEVLARHVHGLLDRGATDVRGMLTVYAHQVLALPVDAALALPWDEAGKAWVPAAAQEEEDEGVEEGE
ncbi:hypothetical protein GGR56DRAFT_671144 [Xylariaceae sp. FL0804]|nr:hypothetical protein GGR56DRAFT_671144 [Xylariaceae sp. FL0804]